VVIACGFLAIEATEPLTEPESCAGCHEMTDVYDSWTASPHHTNPSGVKVTCIDCHLPPREDFTAHFAAKAWSGAKDVAVHLFGEYDAEAARRTVQQTMANKRCLHCHDNLSAKPRCVSLGVVHEMAEQDAGARLYACVVCHDSLHGAKKVLVAKKTPEVEEADNSFCYVCHDNFQAEPFVLSHKAAGIDCTGCHGESLAHADDEEHLTAPEVMYTMDKINPSCTTSECHSTEKMEGLTSHKPFYADPGLHEAKDITCATCHGKHRILERKHSKWNKTTGLLIWKDGHPISEEDVKKLIEANKADGMGMGGM